MKRLLYVLIAMCLCFSLVCCGILNKNVQDATHSMSISGKILIQNPSTEGIDNSGQGFVLLDPVTTAITPIGAVGKNAYFMGESSKILLNSTAKGILLFDIQTRETFPVYQAEMSSISHMEMSYVDDKHISIVEGSELILANINDKSKKVIADDVGNAVHSWSNNGTVVYYSAQPEGEDSQIVRLNIETGHKEILFSGFHPRISKSGKLIAYFLDENMSKVIVKELEGDNQWEYTAPLTDFCLSPDGEYIASIEWWRGIGVYMGCTVKIVDYKTRKAKTIVPKYPSGQCFGIDWTG